MIHRFLFCMFLLTLAASAQPAESPHGDTGESWSWGYGSEEGGSGSSYLGVDIADVSPERLGELKLKEEHGAEVTMVDQDAPAGKAGLHEHDVIVSLNGTAVESAAQLRRMIKETPPGRVVNLGISRDGQPMTIKVQLADRHKSMTWQMPEMPKPPQMPTLPDFDLPVSVVVVHSGLHSGLMVENITPQLGDFFGVKGGNGVLVRSVEKGSRGEKAGFRALRSSPSRAAAVTVMREKREQNLTLTLPEKKDSGSLMEDSFDVPDITAETEQAINRAGDEIARITPAIMEKVQQTLTLTLHSRDMDLRDIDLRDLDKKLQDLQRKMQDRQQEMQQKLRRELSGEWTEI